MQNAHTGSGQQNNNNTGTQNISYGGGQIINYGESQMVIGGSNNFVKNFNTTGPNPIKNLWDAIAGVGASHKAEQQFSRGECLEGTREKALGRIHEWRSAKHQPLPLCWLSGPAGVGKTAIAMTVAKSAEENGLVTSFFFFRSDPRRNNPSALVPSIAHGLTTVNVSLKNAIEKRISDNPTILEARLEDQFRELIVEPCVPKRRWWDCIRRVWEAVRGIRAISDASNAPAVVIIDGLDECGDDRTQLRVLSAIISLYQQYPSFPVRFLVSSRPESWIKDAFRRTPLSRFTKHILLDESFLPSRDIERYYLHAFNEMRERPENARIEFSDPWPSEADLECLVRKSSGQFVYAVVAAKFIGLPSSDPIEQLHHILSYTPDNHSGDSSFSELDLLYHIILSISPNHEELLSILAAVFILPTHAPPSPQFIELLLGLPTGAADRILRYMHSVLNIVTGDVAITVYHTSFIDFLCDSSRSGQFFIDRAARHESLAVQWLQRLTQRLKSITDILNSDYAVLASDDRCLLKTWHSFCFTSRHPTKELLNERNNLFRAILSTFPDRQQLLATLASLILLPADTYNLEQVQALSDSILGVGQVHVSSVMKLLETCQLVMRWRTGEKRLRPFFRAFLCDPESQEYYIDVSKRRELLAQQWIMLLVPSNQLHAPSAESDLGLRALWEGWADFCCGIDRPSDELLSELESLDLMVVAMSLVRMHSGNSFMVTRPFEAITSWLTREGGPMKVIQHFEEAVDFLNDHFNYYESTPYHRPTKSACYELDCIYTSLLKKANCDHNKVRCILAVIFVLPDHLDPSPAFMELLLGFSSEEVELTLRAMRSLLDIRGPGLGLRVYQTSFREYLVDQSRSQTFYIDLTSQKYLIAHQWLQNLSTEKMRTCR
ncbi:hypothetical protein PQX77_010622 [Marasmius sp. AFHP31]|nr:hypothetical protein PQX77_010622 [Marasmius sp. AFHP31]